MHDIRTGRWTRGIQTELTRPNLLDLAEGSIPAIWLCSFVDDAASRSVAGAYKRLAHGTYRNVTPRIAKFGASVFEHPFESRAAYFAEARAAETLLASAMADVPSPLGLFQDSLLGCCGLSSVLARDQCYGDYFAGIFRSIEEGTPIHIDFAPHESPGWEMISGVAAQLSANVYLDGTAEEGGLILYDRLWMPELERYRFAGRFGYHEDAVQASACEVIRPTLGSLVLFNSRFFHRVEAAWRQRLTYSFFFAPQNDDIILWS
jgi:hypothetical protein